MKPLAIAAFALATLVATSAAAQNRQGSTPTNPGPVIPGVCIYSHQRVLAQSTVGQSVSAGMQRLEQEVMGQLAPYQSSIQSEIQSLQQSGASLPPAERQSRQQAVEERYREAQQLAERLDGELRYTELVQRQRIAEATDPILSALYVERGCGLMLARESTVLFANPAMDVTDTVIQRLNAALPSLTFNRMEVPVQAQQ